MSRFKILAFALLLGSGVATTSTRAQFVEVNELLPALISKGDRAGTSVDIWGDWALVGAPTEPLNDPEYDSPGAAYFFQRQDDGTWAEQQQVTADNNSFTSRFGKSVAIWDGYAVVGSSRHDTDVSDQSGVAYVYELQEDSNTWVNVEILVPSDPTYCGRFGFSVAVWEDRIVVGAHRWPIMSGPGAAYVFERQDNGSWTEVAILTGDDVEVDDAFAYSVDISANFAIVGAPFADTSAEAEIGDNFVIENGGVQLGVETGEGAAYIFWRDPSDGTWYQYIKLTPSDATPDQHFGLSVSISGGGAVVGAYADDSFTGAAYVFELQPDNTWDETQKLTASDKDEGDTFGSSVSISGGRLLVGASTDDAPETHSGSAYVFERQPNGVWTETQRLTASEPDEAIYAFLGGDQFGTVALSGARAAIGAPLFGTYAYGNAYLFENAGAEFCSGLNGSGELTFGQTGNDSPVYNFSLDAGRGATIEYVHFTAIGRTETTSPNRSPDGGFAAYLQQGDLFASTSTREWVQGKRGSQTATFQFPVPINTYGEERGGVHVEAASSCGAMASFKLTFEANANDTPRKQMGSSAATVSTQAALPQTFELEGNYPNPFNPQTVIRYALPHDAVVNLTVYDVTGRAVRALVSGVSQTAGWHEATFEAGNLPSGTYLYRLQAGDFARTGRMVLLK